MDILTRELRATVQANSSTAGVAVGNALDFGTRAPVAAIINAIQVSVEVLTAVAALDRLQGYALIGTDETEAIIEGPLATNIADLNTPLLVMNLSTVVGTVASGVGMTPSPVYVDFRGIPPAARPLTFDGITAVAGGNAGGADVRAQVLVWYQLAQLTDAEISAVIASSA